MRIIGIMRVSVCLGAILIPESLDFHSGYSAPRSRIAGRDRIMTSLFPLETKMASCSGEFVEAVERRKDFWWSREDTLLLISQYREHEKLFRNVNCKKESAWELKTARMAAENPKFSARREQVERKWKSLTLAFLKCCDQNSISGNDRKECLFFREIAEFYGYRSNVRRMRQAAAALGGRIRCALTPGHKKKSYRGNGRGRQE